MSDNTIGRTLATVAITGALAIGGAYTAMNAFAESPSATPSASSSASSGTDQGTNEASGKQQGQRGQAHEHTAASADETSRATAAVKAKDSAVTVTKVEKDPDGSFDVTATKDGAQVRYEVSADYKTVTEGRGGKDGGRGGHGRMQGTEVTGAELTKVTNAVKAKDSAFTVERVMKDDQGNYHVMGTKSGNRAGYEVSSDLKTITAHTMDDKGGRGGMRGTEVTGAELTKVTSAVKAKDSAFTVERVMKDDQGNYHVMGTKSGNRAGYEVSSDLKTITAHTMDGKRGR